MSILFFVKPANVFKQVDWLHFLPFIVYFIAENIWHYGKASISTYALFAINKDVSFLVRDILPFLTLFYLVKSYLVMAKHKKNVKLIASAVNQINLDWLMQFLFILLVTVIIWINDALFELPGLTQATTFIYAASIFFLAYFSIKQKAIFAFKGKDLKEISDILEDKGYKKEVKEILGGTGRAGGEEVTEVWEAENERPKLKRLNAGQVSILSAQLTSLMERDKLFLQNELTLPVVAEKLGITTHEASFLINETTKDNFYNFINSYRVAEAKRLLASAKMDELNILGIAFASGFNSKTTFNTAFKKIVGISPSQYSKEQKK